MVNFCVVFFMNLVKSAKILVTSAPQSMLSWAVLHWWLRIGHSIFIMILYIQCIKKKLHVMF